MSIPWFNPWCAICGTPFIDATDPGRISGRRLYIRRCDCRLVDRFTVQDGVAYKEDGKGGFREVTAEDVQAEIETHEGILAVTSGPLIDVTDKQGAKTLTNSAVCAACGHPIGSIAPELEPDDYGITCTVCGVTIPAAP